MDTHAGRWADAPVLPELPPPPVDRIQVRGAQLLHVYNVDAVNPASREGYTDAVALAWAQLPGGQWAALLAWLSGWQKNNRTTGRGRFAWCRVLEDRTRIMPKVRPVDDEHEWHGQHRDSEFAQAVRDAALTLPENLREAALAPYEAPADAPGSEPNES